MSRYDREHEMQTNLRRSDIGSLHVVGDAPAGGKGGLRRAERCVALPPYGLNESSVSCRVARFAKGSRNESLAKPSLQRLSEVMSEQAWTARVVRENTPQQLRFEFGLWALPLVLYLIQREFGAWLAVPTAHQLMRVPSFPAQKSLYHAWQQTLALVNGWVNKAFRVLRSEAKRLSALIYLADDSRPRTRSTCIDSHWVTSAASRLLGLVRSSFRQLECHYIQG